MTQVVAAILALAKVIPQIASLVNMLKDEIIKAELAAIESRESQLKYELNKITAIQEAARTTGDRNEIINSHRMLTRWYSTYRM
jgi:hypothetical protein